MSTLRPSSAPTSASPLTTPATLAHTLQSPQFAAQVNANWFAIATQAIIYMARSGDPVCPSVAIADHLHSHAVFLRRVMATLCRAGLVEAREGRDGGYRLARSAEQITLADVYRAVNSVVNSVVNSNEPLAAENIAARGPLLEPGVCGALGEVVAETEARILDILAKHTIAAIIARADTLEGRC